VELKLYSGSNHNRTNKVFWLNQCGIETIVQRAICQPLKSRFDWTSVELKLDYPYLAIVIGVSFDWTSVELKRGCQPERPYTPEVLIEPVWNWNKTIYHKRIKTAISFWLNQCGIETRDINVAPPATPEFWLNQCGIETQTRWYLSVRKTRFWLNQCGIETRDKGDLTHWTRKFWLNQCGIETKVMFQFCYINILFWLNQCGIETQTSDR